MGHRIWDRCWSLTRKVEDIIFVRSAQGGKEIAHLRVSVYQLWLQSRDDAEDYRRILANMPFLQRAPASTYVSHLFSLEGERVVRY